MNFLHSCKTPLLGFLSLLAQGPCRTLPKAPSHHLHTVWSALQGEKGGLVSPLLLSSHPAPLFSPADDGSVRDEAHVALCNGRGLDPAVVVDVGELHLVRAKRRGRARVAAVVVFTAMGKDCGVRRAPYARNSAPSHLASQLMAKKMALKPSSSLVSFIFNEARSSSFKLSPFLVGHQGSMAIIGSTLRVLVQ